MKILNLYAQAVCANRNNPLALVKVEEGLELIRIKWPKLSIERLYRFHGSRGLLLTKLRDLYLVSVNGKLFISKDLIEWIPVLEVRLGNVIWHACETPEGMIVQEYGESPTSLFISDNGYSWRRILTNVNVDSSSRHFHYVSYDPYRDTCYVTLGDGNLVRAIVLRGNTWMPIYKGPWQFVPVLVSKDKVLFGFDSGIARGGIGIYYPEREEWNFVLLKWIKHSWVKYAQMNELRIIPWCNVLCSALGAPQAVLVARSLNEWKLLYLGGLSPKFDVYMSIAVGENFAVCSTGRRLVILEKSDFNNALRGETAMIRYKGLMDKLRGLLFMLKRLAQSALPQHKLKLVLS